MQLQMRAISVLAYTRTFYMCSDFYSGLHGLQNSSSA